MQAEHRRRVSLFSRRAVVAVVLAPVLLGASSACSSAGPPPSDARVGSASSAAPRRPATSYIFGRITAESGSTWTVQGIRGNVYAVRVTPRTDYGTLFKPGNRGQFVVGDTVRIAGVFAGTTVTANAVEHMNPPAAGARPPSGTG